MRSVKPDSWPGIGLAVAYFLTGLVVVLDPRATHDEGLLMYGFARSLSDAFVPCLFLQKIKPALALIYAPVARLGLAPYLVLHLGIASAAIAWTHAVARSLEHKRPWLPALIVATSPLFTWSALTGVSNSDGVAATALFLYLLETRKNLFAAGLVLGFLPWIRYEQALFSALLAPWVLLRFRSSVFLAGLVAWPLLYLGGGAIYHRDLLWFVHFLPGISNLTAGNPVLAAEFASHGASTAVISLAIVSPALFFLLLLRVGRLRPVERLLAFLIVGFFTTFVVTHMSPLDIGPAFILGFSSRYAVMPIVAVGLLFGRVIEQHESDVAPRLRDTFVASALLVMGWFFRAVFIVPLLASAASGAFIAAMRQGARRIGLALTLAFLVFLPLHLRAEFVAQFPLTDGTLAPIAAWLDAHPPQSDVYTNHQLLVPYLVRTDHPLASRTKFLLAADHYFELVHLSNPRNGQTAAVLDAIPRSVFGSVVYPEELDPDRVRPGTLFVLIDDARTQQILPPERWNSHLKEVTPNSGFHVYESVP